MGALIYSVSQVNHHIKGMLDSDSTLSQIFVRGEISNYKAYPSGHHYFSLKDNEGTIRCVMFKGEAQSLTFRPQHGMKVVAFGRVTAFPRDGQYQLYCNRMRQDGLGDLNAAFEELKERLGKEGLFDPQHKKPIPTMPKKIALITSSAGAALQDMLRVLRSRWPMSEVVVLPVRVQGVEAPGEIASALLWANYHKVADLIITGRGGGSLEDLWAFNEEKVARAIFASQIPVISAVGHEPDVTIADYVADLRGATPSNGAELAVPHQEDVANYLAQLQKRMANGLKNQVKQQKNYLERYRTSRALQYPMGMIEDRRVLLDYQRTRLAHGFTQSMGDKKQQVARLAAGLDAMSPLKVLGRGYAIPKTPTGEIIHSVTMVQEGDTLAVRVSDGEIPCIVKGSVSSGNQEENL